MRLQIKNTGLLCARMLIPPKPKPVITTWKSKLDTGFTSQGRLKVTCIVEVPGHNVPGDRIGEGGGEEGLQLEQAGQALLLLFLLPALCKNK
jgi:hypothetical protein